MDKRQRLSVNWMVLAMIFGLYFIGAIIYPQLPDMVPSHWNINGEVDGYMSKTAHIIGFPSLILGVYLLMTFAPLLDPKPESYKKFTGVFEGFRFVLVIVLGIFYMATNLVALGYDLPVGKIALLVIGAMFVYLGNYFGKVRHNYTFGIKTPWTLASEEVWNKTHRVSGPLWVITGIIWMLSVFLNERTAFFVDMALLFIVSGYGAVYSYILFKRLNHPRA